MTQGARPGDVIGGRYGLIDIVASGGMGRVWRASDDRLHVQVAVKELWFQGPLSEAQRAVAVRRAEVEALNAVRLRDHPHIVTVHDVVVEDGVPWIVMQFVSGGTLQQRLKGGALPVSEVATLAVSLLEALRAAHAQDIVHRDVKPANVMIDATGRVLLADFGISAPTTGTGLTSTGVVIGSAPYLSPERAAGLPAGPAGDMFSLGVTLYEAVEGRSPFLRPSDLASAHAVRYEPYPPMEHAGPLRPLITGLLRKGAASRLTVDQALALLASAMVGAPPEGPPGDEYTRTRDVGPVEPPVPPPPVPPPPGSAEPGSPPPGSSAPEAPPEPPSGDAGESERVALRITNLAGVSIRAVLGVDELGDIPTGRTLGYALEPFSARTLRVSAPGLATVPRMLRPKPGKVLSVTVRNEDGALRLTGSGTPPRPPRPKPDTAGKAGKDKVDVGVRPPMSSSQRPKPPVPPSPAPSSSEAGNVVVGILVIALILVVLNYVNSEGFSGWASHYLNDSVASARTGDCLYADVRQEARPGEAATSDGHAWVTVPCWAAAAEYEVRTDPTYVANFTSATCVIGASVIWVSQEPGSVTGPNRFPGTYLCAAPKT
ncbi:serine/threonine-protein kinase [Streptomyces sp. BI20]|uniref:serine/threonine-protein kinase n=1 Tax=Streptomyces sp. BI20 TaxID=3403460 RepID=UPI003C742756